MGNTPTNTGIDFSDLGGTSISPISTPVTPAASAPAPSTGIDFSDIGGKPISPITTQTTPPEQPSALSRTGTGVLQGVQEGTAFATPQDHREALVSFLGGPGALQIYKAGKGVVNAVENMVKPTKETAQTQTGPTPYQQAVQDFHKTVQEFRNRDYKNAIPSAVNTGADVLTTMPGPGTFMGPQVREVSEGTRSGADLAAPLARNLTKDVLLGGTIMTPELAEGEEATAAPKAVKQTPAERIVADRAAIQDKAEPIEVNTTQAVRKVGLPEGRTATSDVETQQALADQAARETVNQAEAGKKIQTNLQSGLRDTWNKVADDNGVSRPKADVSIREVGQQVGDSIYARSKAAYKLVDDATDGKFQPNEDALKNVNLKLRDIAGTDDAAEAKLMAQKQRLLWQQDQLFDEAAANGVPKETVNAAKADFKKAQAIYDTNHHVRMTTTGLPPTVAGAEENPEVVKSGNLMNRLVKDYSPEEGGKPGRLTQAVGDENGHSLLGHTSAAQVAENKLASAVINNNPEFSALPATESKALREIIRPRVTAGKIYGTNVDWKGALDDFNKLTPEELKARFSDPAAVRAALRRQASIKTAKQVGGGLGATVVAGGAGKVGWDLAH